MDVEEQIYNSEDKVVMPKVEKEKSMSANDYIKIVKELEAEMYRYKKLAVEQDKKEKGIIINEATNQRFSFIYFLMMIINIIISLSVLIILFIKM